jgi:ubiquinone/menaquinone biosynthesis C-methylase UbiE
MDAARPRPDYLHGYDSDEQARLIAQAVYWRDRLILPDLPYSPGDRLLDIGCGVGAVLRVIAEAHPGLRLHGIDAEPRQIDCARRHLRGVGADKPDLRVGDAAALPWADAAIDHVYMMWFIEHLPECVARRVLREARRVLRPGGTITINETDYTTFKVWPPSPDWDVLEQAQHDHFARAGNPIAGRRLAGLLAEAGFADVSSRIMGFHFSNAADAGALRAHAEYIAGFLDPAVPPLAAQGADEAALRRGVEHLRRVVPSHPEGSFTNIVYRARGISPGT